MRARMMCGALLALAANLAAQAPEVPAAAVPKAPKGPTKAEFRVGGFMVSGQRNYDYLNSVTSNEGSIKGVEVLLRGSGAGIWVRSLSGEFTDKQPKIISAEARLLLFPPVFTVFGGAGKRVVSGVIDKLYDFYVAGVSSTVSIGGTGLRTYISGAMLLAPDKSGGTSAIKNPSNGIEAEAAIFYRIPRVPFFMMVGYRTETFTGVSTIPGTPPATIKSPEEVRGLRFGGGIQFGGH